MLDLTGVAQKGKEQRKRVGRFDSLASQVQGRGTRKDKLLGLSPSHHSMHPSEARAWFFSNGFVQNIISAPAEDATREWITITTNRDDDLKINRLIENRLAELEIQNKLEELIRYMRIFEDGGFMYFGIDSNQIPHREILKEPMPSRIRKIAYINVFSSEHASLIHQNGYDPLAKNYHSFDSYIYGTLVHASRFSWMVNNYSFEEQRGVSVIDTILDAIKAQDTALWSVTSLIMEMSVKVFKSPQTRDDSPAQLMEYLELLRTSLSTQSVAALTEDESLERLEISGLSGGGIKPLFDFIFDNLAGLSRIPKSRLMGQSHGIIGAGQYDLISYYDSIAKFQELKMRPILEIIISLIIKEELGEIYKCLNGEIHSLDWEFCFKPLWRHTEKEQAEIELRQAQADSLYAQNGTLSGQDIRSKRFSDLEEFSSYESASDLSNTSEAEERLAKDLFLEKDNSFEANQENKHTGSLTGFAV